MVFLMVDGLDGVGKGVVISAIVEYEKARLREIFDCQEWWGDLKNPKRDYNPRISDIRPGSLVISSEPTFAGIGRRIRKEYIKDNGRDYDPRLIANAYALDRYELYTTTILPVLSRGDDIVQSRGVVTSLVYQLVDSLQRSKRGMDIGDICKLEGNALALRYAPTVLLIPTVNDVEGLMARLSSRDKKDEAIFENVEFQKKLKPLYESKELRDLFASKGCIVEYIDAGISVEDTGRQAVEVWKTVREFGYSGG